MAERGRKKVNPDYNPVKARNEMAEAAAQIYLHPEADMETDRNGKASMKAMKEYFGLTMTKIRKLLVTAGVYSFENSLRVVNSKCTNEKNAHYENPFCTGRVFFRAGCHDYESASVSFHGPCVVDSEELIHCRNDSLLVFLAF